jgi:hypothetical protein
MVALLALPGLALLPPGAEGYASDNDSMLVSGSADVSATASSAEGGSLSGAADNTGAVAPANPGAGGTGADGSGNPALPGGGTAPDTGAGQADPNAGSGGAVGGGDTANSDGTQGSVPGDGNVPGGDNQPSTPGTPGEGGQPGEGSTPGTPGEGSQPGEGPSDGTDPSGGSEGPSGGGDNTTGAGILQPTQPLVPDPAATDGSQAAAADQLVEAEQTDGLKVLEVDGVMDMTSAQAFAAGFNIYEGILIHYNEGTGGSGSVGSPIQVPARVDGIPVTVIGEYAFYLSRGASQLVSVAIPSTVRSIGRSAFEDTTNLREVVLSDGLQTIGTNAFKGSGLSAMTLPSTLRSIGDNAFQGCGLVTLSLPPSLQSIGDYVFADNLSLQSLGLPQSSLALGKYCFSGCSSLTNVTIPWTISEIPEGAFKGCDLNSLALPEGLRYIRDSAFQGNARISSLRFPSSLRGIGTLAFADCIGLETVHIPPTLVQANPDDPYDLPIANGCFYNVPKTMYGYVEAGSFGVKHLRNQGFLNYQVTAWSADKIIKLVYEKDVLPDNLVVAESELDAAILAQPFYQALLMSGYKSVWGKRIELSVNGSPCGPPVNKLSLSLKCSPEFLARHPILYSVIAPDQQNPELLIFNQFYGLPEVDGYLQLEVNSDSRTVWGGNYLLGYMGNPPGSEDENEDEEEEDDRSSNGVRAPIVSGFGGGSSDSDETPRYSSRNSTEKTGLIEAKKVSDTSKQESGAATAGQQQQRQEAVDQPPPEAAPVTAPTGILSAATLRIGGFEVSMPLACAFLIECLVLAIVLFYIIKAARMRNAERHL